MADHSGIPAVMRTADDQGEENRGSTPGESDNHTLIFEDEIQLMNAPAGILRSKLHQRETAKNQLYAKYDQLKLESKTLVSLWQPSLAEHSIGQSILLAPCRPLCV